MQFYASDIMSTDLLSVRPDTTCHGLLAFFQENDVSGAPVVDAHGALVGVITLTDLFKKSLNSTYLRNYFEEAELSTNYLAQAIDEGAILDGFVREFMSDTVMTATPQTPIEELARLMFKNAIHRVIIIEPETNEPVGIVTTFDLLKIMAEAKTAA